MSQMWVITQDVKYVKALDILNAWGKIEDLMV